jgi:hypothetical protein
MVLRTIHTGYVLPDPFEFGERYNVYWAVERFMAPIIVYDARVNKSLYLA